MVCSPLTYQKLATVSRLALTVLDAEGRGQSHIFSVTSQIMPVESLIPHPDMLFAKGISLCQICACKISLHTRTMPNISSPVHARLEM